MSTRSQILFRQGKDKVMIYRHSDGYPSSALSELVEFFQWNQGRNTDLSYTVANYIYYMKKDQEQYCDYFETGKMTNDNNYTRNWKDSKYAKDGNLSTKLGYGIVDSSTIGSWTEYFYDVELRNLKTLDNTEQVEIAIKCYSANIEKDESLKKFLPHAKLVQFVVLSTKGDVMQNTVHDKEESQLFVPEVVHDASGLNVVMGDLNKFTTKDLFP